MENSDGTDLVSEDQTEQALGHIMATAAECCLPAIRGLSETQKTLRIARGTLTLDKQFANKSLMTMVKGLCGNELGFGSDKQYDDQTLRRGVIVALMKGARLTSFDGPEWMLLAGKCYLRKPFYRRMLNSMDGIRNVVVRTEAHEQLDTQTAYVPTTIELRDGGRLRKWEFRKTIDKDKNVVDRRIAVRVNSGMIVDGILGKAESKALRRVYAELSGEDIPDDDPDDDRSSGQEFAEDGLPK